MKKGQKGIRRPRTRVRGVSFLNIEGTSQARDTEFKSDVRQALGNVVQSPLDHMIEEEERPQKENQEIQSSRFKNRLIKYAGLTSKQRICYDLLTFEDPPLTLKQAGIKLGISPFSVWSRYKRACQKIDKISLRILEGRRIANLITAYIYRAKLRNVFHLYFERVWPPQKIAKALRKSLASIYKNIRTLRWLAYAYSPKAAAKTEIFFAEGRKIYVSVKKPSQIPERWPK